MQQGLISEEYFEKYPQYMPTQTDSNLCLHMGQDELEAKFPAVSSG